MPKYLLICIQDEKGSEMIFCIFLDHLFLREKNLDCKQEITFLIFYDRSHIASSMRTHFM